MATKPKPPILPSNPADPAGVDRLERGAMREFDRRIKRILKLYNEAVIKIPAEPVVNRRYVYRLDASLLRSLLVQFDLEVDSILLEGGEGGLWFFDRYVEVAAIRGTAQEYANLAQQSPVYRSGRESLQNILRSEPHQRRLLLVRARVFEEMKGLSGNMKANMARILTDGIGRGMNPREVARNLRAQTGIEQRRAHRIARTEITTALRRARWDEAEEAQELYGLQTMEMHLSALSATTRKSHAARHAKLYTLEQVRDWWSKDGNSVNCKCSTTSVMVDDNGKPIVPGIVTRAKQTKEIMEKRKYPWVPKKESEDET